jgi:hypothetical protein
MFIRDAPAKYRVPSRVLRQPLNNLATICAIRIALGQIGLIEDDEQKQVYRWATKFTRASSKNGDLYTTCEIRAALRADITGSMTLTEAVEECGIPKLRHHKYIKMLLKSLGAPSAKKLWMMYANGSLKEPKLKAALATIYKATMGRPTLLTMDEEALLVAQGEMKAVVASEAAWWATKSDGRSLLPK